MRAMVVTFITLQNAAVSRFLPAGSVYILKDVPDAFPS